MSDSPDTTGTDEDAAPTEAEQYRDRQNAAAATREQLLIDKAVAEHLSGRVVELSASVQILSEEVVNLRALLDAASGGPTGGTSHD